VARINVRVTGKRAEAEPGPLAQVSDGVTKSLAAHLDLSVLPALPSRRVGRGQQQRSFQELSQR
jgi:hypothetical protein